LLSQQITLNGEKKEVLFSSNDGAFVGGLSTIIFANLQTDSVGSRMKQGFIRALYGMEFNWLGFYSDLEFKSKNQENISNKTDFLANQIYLQINPKNFNVNIIVGRFRTSAASISPYSYKYTERAVAKGYGISSQFFGEYANGVKLIAYIFPNVSFAFDITGKSEKFVSPVYNSKTEMSAGLYVDIPSYYLKFSTGTQFCEEFRRTGTRVSWYNNRGGIFFLDGSFFMESPKDYESFFSYDGMIGVRMKNFEYHLGVENGMQYYRTKRTFLNNGIRMDIEKGPSKYVLLADYQTPLGEQSKEWELNLSLLIFTDF